MVLRFRPLATGLVTLGMALGGGVPLRAQPPSWGLGYTLGSRHQEIEVSFLPFLGPQRSEGIFNRVTAGVGLVLPVEHGRSTGVRVHLDLLGNQGRWYYQAGPLLSGGEGLGLGLGVRAGLGFRFNPVLRAGVVVDAVAGTQGGLGSMGGQLAFTF